MISGMAHDAQAGVDLAERLGRRRLAGAGGSDQEHVIGLVGDRQSVRQAQRADFDLVFQFGDGPLDLGQTDLVVQQFAPFGEQFGTQVVVLEFLALRR